MKYLFVLTLLLGVSCIDQIDIQTEDSLRVLVVEGSISTSPGPHEIKLSRSAQFGDIFVDFSRPESRAFVRIRDEGGSQVTLEEQSEGVYTTPPNFRAEQGSSYSLVINTANGEQFVSIPEEVPEAPLIDSLIAVYKRLPSVDDFLFDHGVEVYSVFRDDPDQQNFYLYKNSGTFLIETSPELHVFNPPEGRPVPDPKDCCSICWVDEINGDTELRVLDDMEFNGNNVTQLASFIIDDGARYDDKYLIRIEQHAISKEAFQFFELLNSQLSISGNLFDPPPATCLLYTSPSPRD